MKNWKVELITGEKTLAEVKIQQGVFQADVILLLLFEIAMIPPSYTLKKHNGGYRFIKS